MEIEKIVNKIREAGCELVQTSDNWLELGGADKLDPETLTQYVMNKHKINEYLLDD